MAAPLELPELFVTDGIDRYLVRGELRERPSRFRTRAEGIFLARLVGEFGRWSQKCIGFGGEALIDMGYRLHEEPPTALGIPVSYLRESAVRESPDDCWWIHDRPEVAVELVTADEPAGLLNERLGEYLACGVPLVWLADPLAETVTVLRPGSGAEVLERADRLTADPELPGFSCPVAALFR